MILVRSGRVAPGTSGRDRFVVHAPRVAREAELDERASGTARSDRPAWPRCSSFFGRGRLAGKSMVLPRSQETNPVGDGFPRLLRQVGAERISRRAVDPVAAVREGRSRIRRAGKARTIRRRRARRCQARSSRRLHRIGHEREGDLAVERARSRPEPEPGTSVLERRRSAPRRGSVRFASSLATGPPSITS